MLGRFDHFGTTIDFSETPGRIWVRRHWSVSTHEIMHEYGFDDDDIDKLVEMVVLTGELTSKLEPFSDRQESVREVSSSGLFGPIGEDAADARVDLDPFTALVTRSPRVEPVGAEIAHAGGHPLVPEPELAAEDIVHLVGAVSMGFHAARRASPVW